MAEIKKFKRGAVGRLLLHNNRTQDDGVTHSNEMIDLSKTPENYILNAGGIDAYRKRMAEIYHIDRADLVTLAEAIVTLPRDVNPRDERKFFEGVYDFYKTDFGEKNIINAVVHKDESQPHIHFDFIPVKPREDSLRVQNYEKEHGLTVDGMLNARSVLNRIYFQKMHPRLLQFMTERLGYECEILNGATANGNLTITQLKLKTLTEQLEYRKQDLEKLNTNYKRIMQYIQESGLNREYFNFADLFNRMIALDEENSLLKETIATNGIIIPTVISKRLYEITPKMSVFCGNQDIPTDGIKVIEIYKDRPRALKEDKYIKENGLEDIVEKTKTLHYDEERNLILFPTDTMSDTINCLSSLRTLKTNGKKVIMPKISNDFFDISATILAQSNLNVIYLMDSLNKSDMVNEKVHSI